MVSAQELERKRTQKCACGQGMVLVAHFCAQLPFLMYMDVVGHGDGAVRAFLSIRSNV